MSALTNGTCRQLASSAVRGCPKARRDLIELLWPSWQRQVRSSRALRAMNATEDDVTNVVVTLVEKLTPPHGRALENYPAWQSRHPEKDFDDWMRIVTANVVRDYVRSLRRTPRAVLPLEEQISPRKMLNEYMLSGAGTLSERPPFTAKETARQLIEFAASRLDEPQARALGLWLKGGSFEDIGELLSAPEGQARRIVRASLAKLRREFAGGSI